MADTENAAFWLPTHFLTDDDLFSANKDPFVSHSALDSPVSSSETEEDELLAELTRQLAHSSLHEKPWRYSTSPQSTLTGFGPWSNGSPNGPSQVPSPPLTPPGSKNDAAWDLLYEAAGQVARLKMNAIAAQLNHHQQQQNKGLLGAPRGHHHFYDYPNTNQFQQVRRQGMTECYCHHHQRRSSGAALGLPQSAWPPLRTRQPPQQQPQYRQNHPHPSGEQGMRAVFLGGSGSGSGQGTGPGLKRQSTGTGVFIPRRGWTQPETRKKPSGCSTVLLPARVVQALNLDIDDMNGVNHDTQSRLTPGFVTDHEVLMARRNALLNMQRRNSRENGPTMVGHDIRLPSDWTY